MDILDILNGRFEETLPAVYYAKKPERIAFIKNADDLYKLEAGKPFDYSIINPNEYRYKSLLSNIMTDGTSTVIMTKEQLDYKAKGFVTLADGTTYQIEAVTVDTSRVPKEAMRILPVPIGTEYILTLHEYDNGGLF